MGLKTGVAETIALAPARNPESSPFLATSRTTTLPPSPLHVQLGGFMLTPVQMSAGNACVPRPPGLAEIRQEPELAALTRRSRMPVGGIQLKPSMKPRSEIFETSSR